MIQLIRKRKLSVIILLLLIGAGITFAEGIRYLIITRSSSNEAIQPFADWKNKKGLKSKIVQFTTLPDTGDIKNSIRYYQPEYVLLVGDRDSIPLGRYFPKWDTSDTGTWTDQNYANITDNNGYKDDIYLGRLPCSNIGQCSTMVNKILAYERDIGLKNSDWFIKATGIARDSLPDSLAWQNLYKYAIRRIDSILDTAGFSQIDTLFAGYNANKLIVEDSVGKGRGFVVYRGSALRRTDNWRSPFNVRPEYVNNDSMPTIIISTTCRTMFCPAWERERDSVAGIRWLRQDTPTSHKGAASFWGTTTHYYGVPSTHPDWYAFATYQVYWRNAAAIRFFQAITEDPVFILGEAIRRAKDSAFVCCSLYTFGHQSHAVACSVAYMKWNLLGDPELNLRTAVPQPLLVNHDSVIPTGSQTYIVKVKEQNNQPVSNALVCVMMPNDTSVYEYGYTDEYGSATLQISPKDSGWLYVTVTARNHIPYEDSCLVERIGPDATGRNQGCHLARAPNSTELEWTFYANNSIFWQWMKDETARFLTYIGKGKYPSIAKNEEGSSWVSYTTIDSLNCLIQDNGGSWKKVNVARGDSIGAPSLVLSVYPDQAGPLGYVVYMAKSDELGQCIHFSAFDSLGVYYHTVLDNGDVYEPSISITPKDLLHIVWRKEDRIYYITTTEGITPGYIRNNGEPRWSATVRISSPVYPVTEPASNPSAEAYGEYVYAAWRGPNESGDSTKGDIWRRARWLQRPPNVWYPPRNRSETQNNESNFPVMSTNFVTVWQEQVNDTNWDIWQGLNLKHHLNLFLKLQNLPSTRILLGIGTQSL